MMSKIATVAVVVLVVVVVLCLIKTIEQSHRGMPKYAMNNIQYTGNLCPYKVGNTVTVGREGYGRDGATLGCWKF